MRLARVLLAVLAVAAVFASVAQADDVTPLGTIDLSSATPILVGGGPGDQIDSQVSGDLISYTDFVSGRGVIRYHDLATGSDEAVPKADADTNDTQSKIRGTTIVYSHFTETPNHHSIYEFDTSDPSTPPYELDPGRPVDARVASIGEQAIPWAEVFPDGHLDMVAWDRATGTAERLTSDPLADFDPSASPTGAAFTWVKCASLAGSCDVWLASRSDGVWTERPLTSDQHTTPQTPATDGSIVAYTNDRDGRQEIYWQPLAGGPESHLVLDGQPGGPFIPQLRSVSEGVIAFDLYNAADQQFDIYAYDTNTGFLYRLTSTPEDESLSAISVSGDTATVTYSKLEVTGDSNVYATRFALEEPPQVGADHSQVSADEGSSVENSGTVSDPNGDAVSLSASVGHVTDNGDGTWSWSYSATDDGPAPAQTVTITASDSHGLSDSTSFQYTVDNVSPSATFNAPPSAAPSSPFTISLTGPSDPSSADTSAGFTYSFDCGDGVFSPYGSSNSASCVAPAASGPVTVHGRIQDKDGGVSTYSATVQVSSPSSPIVFTSTRDGNSEIYSMHADGSGVTRLTHNSAIDAGAVWSPDHSKVAFVSTRSGMSDIYAMNADGSGVTRLTSSRAIDLTPAWSPNGNKIAFASNRDGDFDIYTMNAADGSGVTRVTNNHAQDATPDWSPDGTKIAFSTTKDGNVEIYSMNANGSGLTRLTSNRAIDLTPSWSPDGSRIVFSTNRDGNFELYSMSPSGGGLTRLTTNHASDITPAWSASGRIVFSTDRDHNLEIYSIKADGSDPTRLTSTPALDTLPDA